MYVNKCRLEFNGQSFEDFDTFTENSVTFHKQVNLMNKTGHAEMTPRYGFSVSVKKPYTGELNLDIIKNGTLTVEYDNGSRHTFSGVYTLESGDGAISGETELTMVKTFGAEFKSEE
jgi:hypothetical protein